MPKPANRPTSRYATEAAELLGLLIRHARIARKMTAQEVAERAGMSRGLVSRIEKGDLGTSIGAAFEVAAVLGLRLFDLDGRGITFRATEARSVNTLLPQTVRASSAQVDDDF
ncbi:helix-turn-helix transcriptional regulator [Pelagibacterium luteolum]|uniref:DNA-binding transcriptional regulator, XRE-family HTH domain n=1 Tax=Pelagibacterium luteolum TaxID=440168 RepID=A0A1G7XUN4_9HYPH|nr:helix-turn-helix transcriptional regulator [Pelagibacterium luteolum]SDG87851.1 DNA-binding transcriptional regulator, XRE-family HTH domain [Pelagibacterium luteolum]